MEKTYQIVSYGRCVWDKDANDNDQDVSFPEVFPAEWTKNLNPVLNLLYVKLHCFLFYFMYMIYFKKMNKNSVLQ